MNSKLFLIKLFHTIIWAIMASCVMIVFFAGLFGILNFYVYLSIAVIVGEGITLLAFRWSCPLTIIAKRYTENREDNFDIFLPGILAKYNKHIFTTLFVAGLALVILRTIF